MTSPRAYQQPGLGPPSQSASVNVPSRSADRLSPFHIRPGHIAGPHPLPSRQFQALFDSLFKVLFIFPSRYLFAIGLSPVFSLGRNLPPDWGCIPKQPDSPTAPRGATGSGHDGALTLSGAPFQGTWARSATEDASPDYNSDAEGDRFSWRALGLMASGATCVQRLDGSRDSAIHTKYRISLRSSSMQEPRYPLPRVIVQWTSHNVAGSEPLTSPQSEHFTGPFNRIKKELSVCQSLLCLDLLFVFHKSKNFTSDYEIRMPPTVPVNHYSDPEGQHNRIRILWCYPMLMYTERQERIAGRRDEPTGAHRRRTDRPNPRSNYELFNCNNLNIRYWSWNYRGCWHQTCPPMDPR
ncbi:hypothetical protein GLYMA_13G012900v4 [Glycine max]|uniref:Uncharacterized protein n=1 Tax=Glycine max TaxID=3847 RepID=A0A0R0GH31_SOYBN|nr:hypothetical protein GLYMA_13G012900v4 [Glycine max]